MSEHNHDEELEAYEKRVEEGRRSRNWASGPWDGEPNRIEFEHAGFPCIVLRSPGGGNLCGYVGVASGHPWHGKQTGDVDADVHGGITYSEECAGAVCHVQKPGEPENLWWLGFDCAHYGDRTPTNGDYAEPWSSYKDIDYVRRETESLAMQAKKAGEQQ